MSKLPDAGLARRTALTAVGSAALLGATKVCGGTVARQNQLQRQHVASVKEFGAVGDGLADDTLAIQQAINAVSQVFLPAGTYKITSSITLRSNSSIFGVGAASAIHIAADRVQAFTTGTSSDKSNIIIRDLLINGGGQVTDIYTGYRAGVGIYLSRARNVVIENITILKMGVANQASPKKDNGWGGYGIFVEARHGSVQNIRITNCTISFIAGGGINAGDGLYVAGYQPDNFTSYVDVAIIACWVSTVGRHCYTVAGDSTSSIPSGVKYFGCYGEKSALNGLDIEDGYDVLVDGCTFKDCGNDQTYYKPLSVFGVTYRLLAGIATSHASQRITISNSTFDSCYYGITEGGDTFIVRDCVFTNSTASDFRRGPAGSSKNMQLIGCFFKTALDLLDFYLPNRESGFCAENCVFYGTTKVASMLEGTFRGCTFKKGFVVTGGSAGFSRNRFTGCNFTDWEGAGIDCSGPNYQSADVLVEGCNFVGSGNMTYAISLGHKSTNRWALTNNTFTGQIIAAINHPNGGGLHPFDARSNSFSGCAAGILIAHAINDTIIDGNVFSNVSGYCIAITNIDSSAPMARTSIVNNLVSLGCKKGIAILVSTGTFDYCVVAGNSAHGAAESKWSLTSGQNTHGVTVNNITV